PARVERLRAAPRVDAPDLAGCGLRYVQRPARPDRAARGCSAGQAREQFRRPGIRAWTRRARGERDLSGQITGKTPVAGVIRELSHRQRAPRHPGKSPRRGPRHTHSSGMSPTADVLDVAQYSSESSDVLRSATRIRVKDIVAARRSLR